jgi:LacI family transcriptional regulator
LLLQAHRVFYQELAAAIRSAAAASEHCAIEHRIEFLDNHSPQNVAARMLALGEDCDAIGVVAAMHPLVTEAVVDLQRRSVPVFALISPISAAGTVQYVGLDNWKVGRTAAWACEQICTGPGKLGILVGNHRYQCQEQNESGFRSYFREHAPEFTLLEPLSTFEQSAIAQEMTEKLLREHPDLAGLFLAGGGITGTVAALRANDRAGKVVVVGQQLMSVTRQALLDGVLTLVISVPLGRVAMDATKGMMLAVDGKSEAGTYTSVLPFEIYTRENI